MDLIEDGVLAPLILRERRRVGEVGRGALGRGHEAVPGLQLGMAASRVQPGADDERGDDADGEEDEAHQPGAKARAERRGGRQRREG